MNINKEIFLKKLKKLIKENFKTQKDFSKQIGFDESHVSRWLKGTVNPNLDVIYRISQHCNLHISYFFTEDPNNNIINQDIFNQVFKLAFNFAEENDIIINGSYFLACYDLVVNSMHKDNVDVVTSFNNNKSIILKFLK